jgi:hypothetical protein
MAPRNARGRANLGKATARPRSERSGRRLDQQLKAADRTPQHARIRVAAAIASVDGALPPRDWAEALIDAVGFLLVGDESVPTDRIDEIAAEIGATIAAIAKAERRGCP